MYETHSGKGLAPRMLGRWDGLDGDDRVSNLRRGVVTHARKWSEARGVPGCSVLGGGIDGVCEVLF